MPAGHPGQAFPNVSAAHQPGGQRDMVHVLDLADAAGAMTLAAECAREFGTVQDGRFAAEARAIAHDLPRAAREVMARGWRAADIETIRIRGHLIEEAVLEPTPMDWIMAGTPNGRVYEFLLVLYGALLGEIFGWSTQQQGRLVLDVVPMPGYENELISFCSERELSWHTEDAFSPYRGDYVGLMCLRSPDNIPTTIATVDFGEVPADIAEVLGQPRFITAPDISHVAGTEGPCDAVAIFEEHESGMRLRIDRDFTQAREGDKDAARALEWITHELDHNLRDMRLEAGDVCFLDNHRVVHGRRPFTPRYNGRDRWLKRISVVRDGRRIRRALADPQLPVVGAPGTA